MAPRASRQVRPFQVDDAGVAAELAAELPVTRVHGVDTARPALQQNPGEPACRSAEVHALTVRDVDREPVERGAELVLAAERPVRTEHHRGIGAHERPGVRDHAPVDEDVSRDDRGLGIGDVGSGARQLLEHVAELPA